MAAPFLGMIGGKKMIRINGKDVDAAGMKLSEYLEGENYNPKTIAVELNECIVPRDSYANTVFQDGDVVEIVNFVGGG